MDPIRVGLCGFGTVGSGTFRWLERNRLEIAARVGVSEPTVRLWLRRFAAEGAAALTHDAPGRGRHSTIDAETMLSRLRDAQLLDADGRPRSVKDAAAYLGVSGASIRRALQKHRSQR